MDASTCVLKALNHEEPDRVPSFETTFTNNTIMEYHGVPSREIVSGVDYYAIRIAVAHVRTSYIGPLWVASP
ncbi:MAG: hypothetical protein ACFFDM_06070 [Candidatus Thorarchaeota archaeon]